MISFMNAVRAPEHQVDEMRPGQVLRGRLFFSDGAPGPEGVFVRGEPNLLIQLDAENAPIGWTVGNRMTISGREVDLLVTISNESTRVDQEVVDVDGEPNFVLVKVCEDCGAQAPPVRCQSHSTAEYHSNGCGGKVTTKAIRVSEEQ